MVRNQLKAINLDPKHYGLHSMRSGGGGGGGGEGASLAASLGVPDRLIMRQGSWKSISSKNRYIKESLDSLLSVSKAFCL